MTMESYFTKYIFKIDLSIENSQGCNGFRNIYIRNNIFKYNYFYMIWYSHKYMYKR